jgi:hypothetical protein
MRANTIGVLVFLVIGSGCLCGAAYAAHRTQASIAEHRTWPEVDAVVVSVTWDTKPNGEAQYRATKEWHGPDGKAYHAETYVPSSSTFSQGEKVRLRYNPANPQEAAGNDSWLLAFVLGVIGTAFVGIALRVVFDSLRRGPGAQGTQV